MEHQNWEPQVIRKTAAQLKADALRKGDKVTVERKSGEAQRLAKVEREEFTKAKQLAPESRQELIQKRLAEKLTQQQLDQQEEIQVELIPVETVRQMLWNNEFDQALHATCLFYAFRQLDALRYV